MDYYGLIKPRLQMSLGDIKRTVDAAAPQNKHCVGLFRGPRKGKNIKNGNN
jgi:hypothetical protein